MQAGQLRKRVTIQQKLAPASIVNTFGEEAVQLDASWENVGTYWAAIEPLSGREFIEARQESSQITTRIRMRHQGRTTILPAMRVVFAPPSGDERVYDIDTVIDRNERNRELVLMCRERAYG
jgi:SPP1 family predicted phage head-tail adaptor